MKVLREIFPSVILHLLDWKDRKVMWMQICIDICLSVWVEFNGSKFGLVGQKSRKGGC